MAIECRNDKSSVWWQQWRWPKLLRLARAHGWEPKGTSQPPGEEVHFPNGRWDSTNYTSNDGQIVSADDAQALALALERALPHIPDDDALAKYRLPNGNIEIAPNHPPAPDADWFSGAEPKTDVEQFIAFCRQGSFRIY
jgi:hypothetical protein